MAKIVRKNQKIFGSSAGADEIAKFGSLAASAPAFTTDPETIQSLANYLTGWFGAVIGGNSPAIEDMNAICYLYAYQLSYIMQAGIPEWNSLTTYYIGSLVNSGGVIYKSLTDANLNNAVTDATKWVNSSGSVQIKIANYQVLVSDKYVRANCTTAGALITMTLPDATLCLGSEFTIKKDSADASGFNVNIAVLNSVTIDGVAAPYALVAPGQFLTVISNGTNWDIVGAG